ncbi:hypothetical protein DC522_04090 [Microvirga sp. KLBC 81]|uniref:hypothetical protein n=1 Tax=Microvirga sp. KLBC 81 TaxID=1862707 RepID=UPI000D51D749|nr:hypothetical protein [Microvirga sp. KLBC 81]PVE25515.1 hypothetical protein DC522_04090 [Microvirga sp. KLBC 81]
MIIALLALAFAMILGGLVAAFFGWDIVLIERGWVMVIAGSFSAACGALLLGITAAVSRLTQIQAELARLETGFNEKMQEEAPSSSTGVSMAALTGGLLGGKLLDRGENKDRDEGQADLPLFADSDKLESVAEARESPDENEIPKGEPFPLFPPRESKGAERRADEEPEIKVPDFLLAERPNETYIEPRVTEADTSLFAGEPKLEEPEERQNALDRDDILEPLPEPVSAREPETEREPEPVLAEEESAASEESAREEEAVKETRSGTTVVGTYNSGNNTYVMFSDGSIEAQTPSGVFRFHSLDELKAFIASGGEGGTAAT